MKPIPIRAMKRAMKFAKKAFADIELRFPLKERLEGYVDYHMEIGLDEGGDGRLFAIMYRVKMQPDILEDGIETATGWTREARLAELGFRRKSGKDAYRIVYADAAKTRGRTDIWSPPRKSIALVGEERILTADELGARTEGSSSEDTAAWNTTRNRSVGTLGPASDPNDVTWDEAHPDSAR